MKVLSTISAKLVRGTVRAWGSRRGAAAVEFAILIPVIAAMLVGLADYGLAMFNKMELTSAARAGAQMALVDSSDSDVIKQAVIDSTELDITTSDITTSETCECADSSSVTCGVTCADSSANRYFYTVTISYDHTLIVTGTAVTLTEAATVRTQ